MTKVPFTLEKVSLFIYLCQEREAMVANYLTTLWAKASPATSYVKKQQAVGLVSTLSPTNETLVQGNYPQGYLSCEL